MSNQTREQRLAGAVYDRVTSALNAGVNRDQYGSLAHKLPVLIRTAGLAQTIAFVEARHKPNSAQRRLLSDLEQVLNVNQLGERSRVADLQEYMLLTQHALAALLWFKRYAQSVLGVESGAEAKEDGNA